MNQHEQQRAGGPAGPERRTEAPAIWLRVSRDGGRTYGPQIPVWLPAPGERPAAVPISSQWPPCACPRHRDTPQEDQ